MTDAANTPPSANAPQRDRLRRYTVQGRPCRAHPSCISGFRADRAAGLIYGPYKVVDPQTGDTRFARHAEEASMLGRFCPYCNQA